MTGVQTCALPIWDAGSVNERAAEVRQAIAGMAANLESLRSVVVRTVRDSTAAA